MIRKDSVSSPYFKTVDAAQGLVETIFSVTNVKDRQNDILLPGAFAKALRGRKPTVVFAHQWQDIGQVLGQVKDWAEYMPGDTRLPADLYAGGYGGAWALVKFNLSVDAGRTAFELVRSGDLKEWSWAFDIDDEGDAYDPELAARKIKSVKEIFELTLCVIGANQLTQVVSAKTSAASVRDDLAMLGVAIASRLPLGAKLPFIADATTRKAAIDHMIAREQAFESAALDRVVKGALVEKTLRAEAEKAVLDERHAHFLRPRRAAR